MDDERLMELRALCNEAEPGSRALYRDEAEEVLAEIDRLRDDLRAAIDERDRALAEVAKAKAERDELLRAASGLAIAAAGRGTP